jgi:dynamin family protein
VITARDDPESASAAIALAWDAATVIGEMGRDELAQRLQIAASRVTRPTTVVCVVGEFKQGKSSLINAILQGNVCPVDDDLSTSAITFVHHSDEQRVRVRRHADGRALVEDVTPDQIAAYVTEQGNPRNERAVDRLDIGLPHPLLAQGLGFVDTPGMGGLGAGHAAATLAFLPYADGLIFVSDASSELTRTELDFLRRAVELCPLVVFALTKTDLMPEWRRIRDLDAAHLKAAGLDIEIVPVSSYLRRIAGSRGDRDLDAESNVGRLLEVLRERVIEPAKRVAAGRAIAETNAALGQVAGSLRTELAALEDPARAAESVRAANGATARLEHLKGPGARWSVLVADRIADLSNASAYRLRTALRKIGRAMDERIETLKSSNEWDQLGRDLASEVAQAVADVYLGLESGLQSLRADVIDLLQEEALEGLTVREFARDVDVASMWGPKPIDESESVPSKVFGQSMAALRGAQTGILMFALVARFAPAGAAAVLMSNPVTLGLGVAFAGQQLLDLQRRKVATRRQKARMEVRQFLDDAQFEVSNELADVVRLVQRQFRDEFGDRISELARTYAETALRLQEDAQRDAASRTERQRLVRSQLAALEPLLARGAELQATAGSMPAAPARAGVA